MNVRRLAAVVLSASLLVSPSLRAGEDWDLELPLWIKSGPAAATRSLLVPGWGQFYNRQRPKGGTLFLLAVGGAAGALLMDARSRDSYQEYRLQGSVSGDAYDRYSREKDFSNLCAVVSIAAWTGAVWDAYIQGKKLGRIYNEKARAPGVELAVGPGAVAAAWRFGGERDE